MPKIIFLLIAWIIAVGLGCDGHDQPKVAPTVVAGHDEHAGHDHANVKKEGKADPCTSCPSDKEHQEHQEHQEASEKTPHDHASHAGHDHADHNVSLDEIAQKKCEHNILQVECDGCRGELGVVKLGPELEKQFLKTQKAVLAIPSTTLELVGEIAVNEVKTVVVSPIVPGRATKAVKRTGDLVNAGDLLAVFQSQEYGKAKLDYISACQRYTLSQKNYEWFKTTHDNLKKMVEALQQNGKDLDLTKFISDIKIGKYKEKLVEATTYYRLTQTKYARERQTLKNMQKLLTLLNNTQGIPATEQYLKELQIGEWKGKLLGAVSRLGVAAKNYEREKTLVQNHASTQKELQEAESSYRSAQAEYQGLIEELSLWVDQKTRELQAEMESALGRYLSMIEEMEIDIDIHHLEMEKEYQEAFFQKATAEKMLSLLGLASQDIQKLSLTDHSLDQPLGTLEIRAPIGGTIIASHISEGQFVEASRELYTISDLSTLWLWCDLYEHDLALIQPFSQTLSQLQASVLFAASFAETVPATVDYISEVVEEKTRTVKMRLVIANDQKKWKPGMFVKVILKIPGQKKIITVPEEAIFKDEKEAFLFKKWKDDFWVRADLNLGVAMGNQREIKSGISEGDLIAVQGGFILKSEIFKGKMGAG